MRKQPEQVNHEGPFALVGVLLCQTQQGGWVVIDTIPKPFTNGFVSPCFLYTGLKGVQG